jgi:pimeloyl-ACP methyl ester carboxylesterase
MSLPSLPHDDSGMHHSLGLPGGRRLAYAVYGEQSLERPVFYLHGIPGGRKEASLAALSAKHEGISLIAVDRPGFGESGYLPKRSILDTPRDITTLADSLGIAEFGMIGVSGGGPHAAACAALLGTRLRSVSLVSSPAPFDAFKAETLQKLQSYMRFLSLHSKTLGRLLTSLFIRRMGKSPDALTKMMSEYMPPADRKLLKNPDVSAMLERNYASISHQEKGLAQELQMLSAPWGFTLGDIATPVHIWHGKADETVPWPMAKYLRTHIPSSVSHFLGGFGHLLIIHKIPEILATMRRDLTRARFA